MAFSKVAEGGFRLSGASGTKNVDFSTVTGSDPIQNDVVIIVGASDGSQVNPWQLTAGYTTLPLHNPTATGPMHAVILKRMGATPDTSVDLDYLSTGGLVAGLIQIWRGVDTTTLLTGTATRANSTTGLPNPPSHTTGSDDALRIITGHLDDDDAASGITAPSGYTDLFAYDTGQGSTSIGATVMIASKIAGAAGAEDPDAFGGTGSDAWFSHHFSLTLGAGGAISLAADSGSFTLTGTAASLERGREVVADSGSYALTGSAATLRKNLPLSADGGSFALTGSAAALERGYEVAADSGSFAITGGDATLQRKLPLPAVSGSFAITGTAASLEYGREVVGEAGSYAVNGASASLERERDFAADAGSYALTGADASIERGLLITASAGSYQITGSDANLTVAAAGAFSLPADSGVFVISGSSASLEFGRSLVASAGSYAVTGDAASLEFGRRLAAGEGSYAIAGSDAALSISGVAPVLAADAGSYAISGQSASLLIGTEIVAEGGVYSITGAAATFRLGRSLDAESGIYSLSGSDAFVGKGYPVIAEAGSYSYGGGAATLSIGRSLVAEIAVYEVTGQSAALTYSAYIPPPPRVAVTPSKRRSSVSTAHERTIVTRKPRRLTAE